MKGRADFGLEVTKRGRISYRPSGPHIFLLQRVSIACNATVVFAMALYVVCLSALPLHFGVLSR